MRRGMRLSKPGTEADSASRVLDRLGKVSAVTSDGRYIMRSGPLPEVDPEVLAGIVTATSDVALVVTPEGTVSTVLTGVQSGLGARLAHWQGQTLESLFTPDSQAKLAARLHELETHRTISVELTHAEGSTFPHPVRYGISRLGAGDTLLLLGRDMRPIAELQQQLVQAQLALERDYEAQRELETRYRVLMEADRDALLIVSASTGRIVDLNAAAAELIGEDRANLIDAPLAQEFDGRRRGELLDGLSRLSAGTGEGRIDLTVRRNRKRTTVTATAFRAAGDRLLLCRFGQPDGGQGRRDGLPEMAERLFEKGVDAIVFLDLEGRVIEANEAFLNLTDSGNPATVQGRSFAEFLSRGAIDLRVLLDNVKRVGHLRHYATRLNTDFDGQISVEVAATLLNDRAAPAVALVIRDAGIVDATRILPGPVGNEGLRNVMQLVGYSTLRDIVAETTEIIEKMCIETALDLTGNNRVAAAELLSLSRQSLYVKLRKFGLLSKDTAD